MKDLLSFLDAHARFIPVLLAIACMTVLNLLVRWIRWHFLARHMGVRMQARISLIIFLSSVIALLTPFSIGEVAVGALLRSYTRRPWLSAAMLWMVSRFGDLVAVTALLLCLSTGSAMRWLIAGFVLMVFSVVAAFHVPFHAADGRGTFAVAVLHASLSIIAWIFPGAGLFTGARMLGVPLAFPQAVGAFAGGTLMGSYVPGGFNVAPAFMLKWLSFLHGFSAQIVMTVAALRLGTVALALFIALATVVLNRRTLRQLLRGSAPCVQGHFDDLSPEYKQEISDHVRTMLLGRKIELMVEALRRNGIHQGARGLDLGCGIGMYAARLARKGFRMIGCDPAAGQIHVAQIESGNQANLEFRVGTLGQLQFPADSFDFVYSINALHHVLSRDEQRRLLAEVARILRPGGIFLLHEINVFNPLNRLYVSYAFPLLKRIDDGTELWLTPSELPVMDNGHWSDEVAYFTFVPDFVPLALISLGQRIERLVANTSLRRFSAHYMATFHKHPANVL